MGVAFYKDLLRFPVSHITQYLEQLTYKVLQSIVNTELIKQTIGTVLYHDIGKFLLSLVTGTVLHHEI